MLASTKLTDDGKNAVLIFTTKKNVDGMFLGIFFAEKNKFVDTLFYPDPAITELLEIKELRR